MREIFWNKIGGIILSVIDFTPTPNFLSDIAAFEAVVIGLAIPLSFEIISRISERYQSEVITKKFIQNWEIRWLPIFLIANIIITISLRFFVWDNPIGATWKILAWINFIGFLFIAGIFLFKFLPKLKRYMTDTNFILEELFNEAEKLFKE